MPKKNKIQNIQSKIYTVRGKKVMIDFDLAELYGIETKSLKRVVKRNRNRFPKDFKIELNEREWKNLKQNFGTSTWGGIRHKPYCFTEYGIAMLSSVLNSEVAIDINIQIIRVFSKMKDLILHQKDLLVRMEKVEKTLGNHDGDIAFIFLSLKKLLNPNNPPRRRIGYRRRDELD